MFLLNVGASSNTSLHPTPTNLPGAGNSTDPFGDSSVSSVPTTDPFADPPAAPSSKFDGLAKSISGMREDLNEYSEITAKLQELDLTSKQRDAEKKIGDQFDSDVTNLGDEIQCLSKPQEDEPNDAKSKREAEIAKLQAEKSIKENLNKESKSKHADLESKCNALKGELDTLTAKLKEEKQKLEKENNDGDPFDNHDDLQDQLSGENIKKNINITNRDNANREKNENRPGLDALKDKVEKIAANREAMAAILEAKNGRETATSKRFKEQANDFRTAMNDGDFEKLERLGFAANPDKVKGRTPDVRESVEENKNNLEAAKTYQTAEGKEELAKSKITRNDQNIGKLNRKIKENTDNANFLEQFSNAIEEYQTQAGEHSGDKDVNQYAEQEYQKRVDEATEARQKMIDFIDSLPEKFEDLKKGLQTVGEGLINLGKEVGSTIVGTLKGLIPAIDNTEKPEDEQFPPVI